LILKIILLLLITTSIFASTEDKITLDWLHKQPKSYAKDFYIWRYLDKDITPQQANEALGQVKYFNDKIFYRYIDKSNDEVYKDYKSCIKSKTSILVDKQGYCIEAGLSIYEATKLSKQNLQKVIKKTEKEYPKFTSKLEVLNSAIPFKTIEQSNVETFFGVFNECGGVYRVEHFNQFFPKSLITKLKNEKEFAQTIKLIVTNPSMNKAQKSLLNLDAKELDFKTTFHLAINAITHKKEKIALQYLNLAYEKAYFKMEKDNISFWQYQLTHDKKYLEDLVSSWDVNIYTLYANNLLKKEQKNIIYTIEQQKKSQNKYDISNPFQWLKVLNDTKTVDDNTLQKYQNTFTSDETLGHLAFVNERYHRYKNSYFVMPFKKHLKKLPKERQALIYAIGRQESRFIPTSISSAYAMGTMQIMPFLSRAIAKQLKEPYDIDKQLESKTNLKYANHHLDYLTKQLDNPLFVAYAYNGGIGFTNRLLKSGFFKKGKYEPYLSMELLPYDETKKYGKKVLANYFIYYNYLNKDKKMNFQTLINGIKNY
jgi:soluble lytic murein transglycosylase